MARLRTYNNRRRNRQEWVLAYAMFDRLNDDLAAAGGICVYLTIDKKGRAITSPTPFPDDDKQVVYLPASTLALLKAMNKEERLEQDFGEPGSLVTVTMPPIIARTDR
jgi:hypothetical protein